MWEPKFISKKCVSLKSETIVLLVIGCLCLIVGSSAVHLEPGPCPIVNILEPNITALHGVMYAYASTENGYDPYQKCEEHHTFLPVDGVAEMLSLRISKKTGNHLKILSEIFENHENSAIYVSSHIPLIGEKNSRYWDVERTPDYGVTWSCENQGNNHAKTVNIYIRKRNLSIDLMKKVQDVCTRIGIQNCYFKRIDQTNCY